MKPLLYFTIAFMILVVIGLIMLLWLWAENWGDTLYPIIFAVILGYIMNNCDRWVAKKRKQIKDEKIETY